MIQIQDLTFNYHKQANLFNQLQLELGTGNIYGLLGKNGAGKTTLLKLIAGMLMPVDGTVTIDETEALKRLPSTLQEIYFIPEEFELPSISAMRMMENMSKFYPKFSLSDYKHFLSTFGVDVNEPLGKLSFGQRKQVVICFGLATNTRYLLLDEPSNGLDIPSKSILRKLLASAINEQRSFIISTHQVRDLENMIDPIVILDQGKIIFNQKVESITEKLSFKALESIDKQPVIYSEPTLSGFHAICPNPDGEPSELDIELLFNGVTTQSPSFEKIFEK
jgi:ABC-2 type transport system ATP-binding protein